jgi:gluconate 5-dehydrogenase
MESLENIFSLENKKILVTGGYGYLGKAICEGLLAAKAQIWVLGQSQEKFDVAFAGRRNIYFQFCNIADSNSIQKAYQQVAEKAKQIDVLINNAFYSKGQNPETMTDEEWNYGIDGSLNSVYRCIREVLPFMKQKGGKIINVASMYGVVSPNFEIYENNDFLNPPHYGAAKAGVVQMTRYFACYLGKYNIQVNAVTPGAFPSESVQKDEDFIEALKKKSPLQRIGNPKDLQGVFILLSSQASDFITGQNIIIDGGWTAW